MNTIRQPSFERLWDDLELGDEEPLKVAKRFIYSRKLQPKYILIINDETRFQNAGFPTFAPSWICMVLSTLHRLINI